LTNCSKNQQILNLKKTIGSREYLDIIWLKKWHRMVHFCIINSIKKNYDITSHSVRKPVQYHNMTKRTGRARAGQKGQNGQNSKDLTARTGQDSKGRTARAGQQGQDSKGRAARAGQQGQDSRGRTAPLPPQYR
jgi:hypothetical protein